MMQIVPHRPPKKKPIKRTKQMLVLAWIFLVVTIALWGWGGYRLYFLRLDIYAPIALIGGAVTAMISHSLFDPKDHDGTYTNGPWVN